MRKSESASGFGSRSSVNHTGKQTSSSGGNPQRYTSAGKIGVSQGSRPLPNHQDKVPANRIIKGSTPHKFPRY